MGKNNKRKNRKRKPQTNKPDTNFVTEAGPGCYIARRDHSPSWLIEWEDVDPSEFEGDEVPDVAVDTEERTLSLCNIRDLTQIAYITVYETAVLDAKGKDLPMGYTRDNTGKEHKCVTFIVLCPPRVFCHLCYLDVPLDQDITSIRIESDVRDWNQHPDPADEHPQRIGFPLEGGPFLCTQGENGTLTHFFSGNLHAIDFRCNVGTPLLAAADGVVMEANDNNTLTGVAVSNLFSWNSIMIKVDHEEGGGEANDPLYIEYVHIQKANLKKGDRVTRGQVIGASGSVGFSPEPHLHFSAFRSSDPIAPTVRVKFQGTRENVDFLPKAGKKRPTPHHLSQSANRTTNDKKMTKYEDYDWEELPADIQEAAKLLGYNQELWDNDDEPDECDEWWKDLSSAQQDAATKLGYTEDSWNSS
ncbi:unnamed protein product [Cylindrotheca closterium]|uniref:M23ase beta-sheet core domain-containing protein n=1 Tax=Cylindrotheca closterium TaxID=2856 RepID=A0AAD2GA31_9STRA|nr:unnamed protein product [Cylindrotheca closterium]